jgi:hypothetical protein
MTTIKGVAPPSEEKSFTAVHPLYPKPDRSNPSLGHTASGNALQMLHMERSMLGSSGKVIPWQIGISAKEILDAAFLRLRAGASAFADGPPDPLKTNILA